MKLLYILILICCILCSCIKHKQIKENNKFFIDANSKFIESLKNLRIKKYHDYVHNSASLYGVDEFLIKAIIQVESGYNSEAISKSNAVGLMQIKPSSAGRDAYRMRGWQGEPSIQDLKNAAVNIDLGTAYLSLLQQKLFGINNNEIRRYALIVSYANGLNTLLRMFSSNDDNYAISKINEFKSKEFYYYMINNHPSLQAQRYLWKVNYVYSMINR